MFRAKPAPAVGAGGLPASLKKVCIVTVTLSSTITLDLNSEPEPNSDSNPSNGRVSYVACLIVSRDQTNSRLASNDTMSALAHRSY